MASFAGSGLSLGTLYVNIAADIGDAVKDLKAFGDIVGEEIDGQKKKWDSLKTAGEGLTSVGTALTAGLTLPIVGIGAASVSAASEFQSSLNKITAVSGTTGAELEQLRAQAMQLGADTKYSAQEAAEGMGNLAAAGWNTTQIMSGMPGVLDLAAAGELSVARAAEVSTDTLGQWGLAASDAGHVADVMAKGAAASSISVEQMAQAMKYAGAVGKDAGLSFEETAAAVAILGNAGIKSEQAGTSLRGIISSLVAPSKAAAETIEALGVTTTDSAGKMLPLENVFGQLKAAGAGTADMFRIFGENAATAGSVLKNSGAPAIQNMTQEMINSEGAAKKMADTLNSGLKGGFEQLKGSLDTVLIALGTALLPTITKIVAAGTDFINNFILPAVTWFGQLPGPVQGVALAIAGIAAAIGPVLVVMGTLISSFATVMPVLTAVGTAVTAFVGTIGLVPIAIAAVVAALVAVGVWVYANWDAIVAVLTKAWDGVKEAFNAFATWIGGWFAPIWNGIVAVWHTIMDPYFALLLAIWTPIIRAFEAAWNGINQFLSDVWTAIKRTAGTVWDSITGAITGFLELCKKIPGVNKLFDLDEAWKNAKKLGDQTKTTGDEAKAAVPKIKAVTTAAADHGAAAGAAAPKIGKAGKATKDHTAEVVKLEKATREFVPPGKDFNQVLVDLHTKAKPATDQLLDLKKQAEEGQKKLADMKLPTVELGDYMKATFGPAAERSAAALQSIGEKAALAKPEAVLLNEALATLGLEGGQKLSDLSGKAAEAYTAIVANGQATQFQKDSAFIKLLEAEQAAMKANGEAIPQYHADMLAEMKRKTEDQTGGLPAITSKFGEFGNQVSTVITNFAQDISKSLWSGDTSFGEKGKALLSSLGQAVTSSFIEPATKAINTFISDVIGDLLGGKGFGGVFDSIKGIGSSIGGIFGGKGGGAAAGGAGNAGGAPGAGGAGGAGSILGSVTGIVGAVGSIGTMISSIVFGMRQEKDMDTLADHTLRTFNEIANLRIDAWLRWGDFLLIKDDFLSRLDRLLDNSNLFVLKFDDCINRLTTVADQSVYVSQMLDAMLAVSDARGARQDSILARMMDSVERIAVSSERAVTMNLYGTDPSLVGGRVAQKLRLQGGFA